MTTGAVRRRVTGPRVAGLVLAVPLAAAGAAGAAGLAPNAYLPAARFDGDLPGLDERRIVVPAGALAGHAVEVSEVASRLEPVEALSRVERHWREREGAVVLRADSDIWKVLSRRIEGGYETLQLRVSVRGGAEGLFTRWRTRGNGSSDDADHHAGLSRLLPADAGAVRQLGSRDPMAGGVRAADTLIGSLPHSIDETEWRIELHLRGAGFTPMRAPGAARNLKWRNDRARFFQTRGAELLVTLHAQPQGTAVVLYHVRVAR
ncbi:MAG: hypothetical protein AMXMBFR52_05580 [Burkholderiales bacterium]|nr:hypothetical protein [Burkholderiaceae bacterium]